MADEEASLPATLLAWCTQLATADVSPSDMVEAIGWVTGGSGTPQLTVRPKDPRWERAEIVSRPDDPAPALVRLFPVAGTDLSVEDLERTFGPPSTTPPKVHFDDPVSLIYEVDTGNSAYTAAVIAELPPEGGSTVDAVTLRRDIRLD